MKKEDFAAAINEISPLELAEEWDNCGWQINLAAGDVKKVLVCLDVCDATVDEAIEKGCDVVLSHHPLLFNAAKCIDMADPKGRYVIKLIQNGISCFAAHTCFDSADGGNNDYILKAVGVSSPEKFCGNICRAGMLDEPVSMKEFAARIEAACMGGVVKYSGDPDRIIKKAAVCTGAGGDFIYDAVKEGVDCFISGEFKHHELIYAKDCGICVADAGHYGTEFCFVENMASQLEALGAGLEIIRTEKEFNPVPNSR